MTVEPLEYRQAPARRSPVADARTIAIQSWAMLVDAYRELNAKKLFWVSLVLSTIIVGAFGAVGFDTTGFSIFWKHFDHPFLNTVILPRAQLYKNLFISLGVNFWLGFFGIILALVSTSSIFPDFLSGGAVDLYLARPLGRWRLFITKYLVGLLFVAVQVIVFCLTSLIVIGVRGGVWVPGIFVAVPVVIVMFSYLWAICALLGTLTRSTIAALLLTTLALFGFFGLDLAERQLLTFSMYAQIDARQQDDVLEGFERRLVELRSKPAATQPKSSVASQIDSLERNLPTWREERARMTDRYAGWFNLAYALKWPLPKMTETTMLLERALDRQFWRARRLTPTTQQTEDEDGPAVRTPFQRRQLWGRAEVEADRQIRARRPMWVIGTSLGFEAVMVALAAWVFARRDY